MILDTFIEFWYVIFLFLIVAILYASAGFGGGSSYLAILALTGLAYTEIRAISILCNILVVSGNVLFYYQKKSFDFKKIIPLVILSVPLAYLGGYIKITQSIFFILFGFTLLFAAITMWISNKILSDHEISTKPNLKKKSILWRFYWFYFWNGWNWWWHLFSTFITSNKLGYSKKNCSYCKYIHFVKFIGWFWGTNFKS